MPAAANCCLGLFTCHTKTTKLTVLQTKYVGHYKQDKHKLLTATVYENCQLKVQVLVKQ